MPTSFSHIVRAVYCSLRGLPILGIGGAFKFLLASIFRKNVTILPKGYMQGLSVRGGTSDVETFFSIIIRAGYPTLERPVSTIIDAGANVGFSAAFFAQNYPQARIFAIEPEINNFNCLVKNTEKYSNVFNIHGALWHESCELYLQSDAVDSWAFQFGKEMKSFEKTKAFSVSDLIKEYRIQRVDILKMDIEGSEKQVFLRDTGWLELVETIFIEIHDRLAPGAGHQIFKKMGDFDYKFDVRFEYVILDRIKRRPSES
jgi:FkbM family methyltransferase